jgi:hypothetical protein
MYPANLAIGPFSEGPIQSLLNTRLSAREEFEHVWNGDTTSVIVVEGFQMAYSQCSLIFLLRKAIVVRLTGK